MADSSPDRSPPVPEAATGGLPSRFVHPGELIVTREPVILSTLLGSCVSVCLFDPAAHLMGMNHFLLPLHNPAGRVPIRAADTGRYGLTAMKRLIDGLFQLGARRNELRAKAFGGACLLVDRNREVPARFDIGAANVRFVERCLDQHAIPLVARDFGGNVGRQIHFHGSDFSVYLRRIPQDTDVRANGRDDLRHKSLEQGHPVLLPECFTRATSMPWVRSKY